MTSTTIHFDSIYAQYTLPQNDPFDARFKLSTPLHNARSIQLKSLELPVNIYNIRSTGTMNQISATTNLSNTYTVSITPGNYTTIASLLSAITSAFVGVIPSTTVTFAASGNKVNVSATSSTITTLRLNDTTLSKYILGFRNLTFTGLNTTGSVDYLLNVDNYINMYISNISAENASSNGDLNCSFKIPLNATNGLIYYSAENTSMKQYVSLLNSSQSPNYLQIVIYDRFNQPILNNNADYSFTLEVFY